MALPKEIVPQQHIITSKSYRILVFHMFGRAGSRRLDYLDWISQLCNGLLSQVTPINKPGRMRMSTIFNGNENQERYGKIR